MLYFECDREYIVLWPTVAVSLAGEFWIELDWLNFVFGWRSGDDGEGTATHVHAQ